MFTKLCLRCVAAITGAKTIHLEKDEYQRLGLDCVRHVYDLLLSEDWKLIKKTKECDTVSSLEDSRLGKVYKLRCHVKYPAKALANALLYDVADIPKWNPTVLESIKLKIFNDRSDITYHVSASHVGGLIKSRDFVNLRSSCLIEDGKLSNESLILNSEEQDRLRIFCANNVIRNESENTLRAIKEHPRSFGRRVWIAAACSVERNELPTNSKYIRGHNLLSAFVMHEVEEDPNECIFEWIMCIDLKSSLPGYVVDKGFTTAMIDFAKYLRNYITVLRHKHCT
ncbi:steroidogenic acute regulatory protein-like [Musca vetustissima]|uniref:steroidogenic acute regulatory protein-like n=1 Tax=Musca vetustissima TaxID=27455 RepID=UPI002AB6EE3B|nr:steroidogenic acute regulatory protein-like [Musca vetustissima]